MPSKLSGADELRRAVNVINCCRETFNDRWTADELLRLYRAYHECGWDITPDQWTQRQITEALQFGWIPHWDATERPVYHDGSKEDDRDG